MGGGGMGGGGMGGGVMGGTGATGADAEQRLRNALRAGTTTQL
jgi:hypothetical protein